MKIFTYPLVLAALLLSFANVTAQDIHFSQIGYSPLNLNPALTGMFEGDMRLTANYRSQWNRVPVSYETFSGAFDMSFYNKQYQKRFFSGGLLFNHDVAGDSRLSLTNLGLSGSYAHRIARGHFLSIGAMGMFSNRSFDMSDLQFDRQYDEESQSFNSNLSNRENFENNSSMNLLDVSAGINWHYRVPKRNKRTSFDVGLGIMHFNQPEEAFMSADDLEKLPVRWSTYLFSTFQLTDNLDLLLQGTYQRQRAHREIAYGGGIQYHLNTNYDEEFSLQLLVNRRSKDSWAPMVGMRYRMWKAAFSYDLNTSEFNVATDGRGGPELSLIYIFTTVKPMEAKICPIYL